MFESFVSDLLNRILGMYIEDLDGSKLKISMWGGDVQLRNLVIKQTALDDLKLPVRPLYGHLESLSIKIPWNKLYTEKWEATVTGFTFLAVPETSIIYNEQKEKELLNYVKQIALQQIEEAKKKSLAPLEKPKDDGFIEKLISQIIRNIQVTIEDIHIRYEDPLACKTMPFSFGIILQNLSLQSTDVNWKVGLDSADFVYKLMTINGFLIYLTPHSSLLYDKSREEISDALKSMKFKNNDKTFKLVLGPLNLVSKLQLNLRPELNEEPFSVPKVDLSINLETLSLALSRHQFSSIMSLLDSLDRTRLSSLYKKHRPSVKTISGNSSIWWKYAYKCKLENIRRIRRNWSWSNMKSHRDKCREYVILYKQKISQTKVSRETVATIKEFEYDLDVFNIVLSRKQAEMEVEKETPPPASNVVTGGWFSSWFSGSTTTNETDKFESSIAENLQSSLDEKDKSDLYEAIGYSQTGVPAELPEEYVDVRVCFILHQLNVSVIDELLDDCEISKASLELVECCLERRFAAAAIKMRSSLQSLNVKGTPQLTDTVGPLVVESLFVSADSPLLRINLETNPLDKLCDIRLHVDARPLNIIYDSTTILHATDLFVPPKDISLQQLQSAAVAKYEVVKEKSVTGIQAAIDKHSKLDLNINFETSRLILTQIGKYSSDGLVVITLGSVKITSNQTDEPRLTDLAASGKEQELILAEMRSSSYEQFTINIEDIQIVAASEEEDWISALTSPTHTPLHLLQRLCLRIDLYRCLITSDPNLAKIKVMANLPKIYLSVIDTRIMRAATVLTKCLESNVTSPSRSTSQTNFQLPEPVNYTNEEVSIVRLQALDLTSQKKETVQFTDFLLVFKIENMVLELLKEENGNSTSILKIASSLNSIEIVQKTFDFSIEVVVKSVSVKNVEEDVVTTYSTGLDSENLIWIKFCKVNPKSPDFLTIHHSTAEQLDIEISGVSVQLEQQILLNLLAFWNDISTRLELAIAQPIAMPKLDVNTELPLKKLKTHDPSNESIPVIHQCVRASLKQIDLKLSSKTRDLLQFNVKGLNVVMMMQNEMKDISTCLDEFSITNPSEDEYYKDIFTLLDKRAWSARVKLYETVQEDYFDTRKWDVELEAEIGRPKIVFLYRVVADVLGWLDKFQAAKDALLSASQAAVQVAKQNLQDTYLRCTKIRLALLLKAPVVVVPNSSKLNGGLIVDLGKIVIKNDFRLGAVKNELGHPCLFDDISVSVENVKISRKTNFESSNENGILAPVSLILFVKRNLSVSWHKTSPEMDINANLKAVKISISDDDIKAFHSILKGNMSELSDDSFKTELSTDQPNVDEENSLEETQFFTQEDVVFNRIILQFSMQAIALDMFTTEILPYSKDNLLERNEFAKFELQAFYSKLFMSSNSDLTIDMQLHNCVMIDTREGANGIVTLLEKKSISTPRDSSIFEMSYVQQNNKTAVSGKVAEFLLVLHLPFLLQLQDILFPTLSEDDIFEEMEDDFKNDAVIIKALLADDKKQSEGVMNVHMKIEKPDIVLVENLRDVDSSSIFLHGEIEADIEFNGPKQRINSKVLNLEMYVACFNEEKRKETMSRILQKSEVSFTSTSDESGESSQIKFGHLDFIATPDYVALLMNIVSCLTVDTDGNSVLKSSSSQDWTNYWDPKPIDYNELSFLKIDVAEEAVDVNEKACGTNHCARINTKRNLTVELDNILLSLEAGTGQSLIPLLKIQSSCLATVECDNNRYEVKGNMNTEVVFFNSKQAIWEPLLEPIENAFIGIEEYRPWQMQFQVIYNENEKDSVRAQSIAPSETSLSVFPSETSSMSSEFDLISELDVPQPITTIRLITNDPLELTVTNTSLEMLQHIQVAFTEAYSGKLTIRQKSQTPYKVVNKTGMHITLYLAQSNLQLNLGSDGSCDKIDLNSGTELGVYEARSTYSHHKRHGSLVFEYQNSVDKHIVIKFPGVDDCCFIPAIKSEKRYFSFINKMTNFKFGIVSCISAKEGCKTILLSSCVEVVNKSGNEVDIYSMSDRGNDLELVCSLPPDKKEYLPVQAIFTPTSELFFAVRGYSVCIQPLFWKRLKNQPDFIQRLSCNPKSESSSQIPFVLTAVCDVDQIFWARTQRKTVDSVMVSIVLRPWMQIYNLLPVSFGLSVVGVDYITVVRPGESTQIDRVHSKNVSLVIEVFSYDESNWLCETEVDENASEFTLISFKKLGVDYEETLDLTLHMTVRKGVKLLRLFSPFWMINKTGYNLIYKGESYHTKLHRQNSNDPVLFMFRRKALIGKNQATVKVNESDWSEKFPLDTVGSTGYVTCHTDKQSYKISVDIQLAISGLTKIVTFTSFYKAINRCPYDLEFLYADDSCKVWQTIASGECIGLWPVVINEGIYVRVTNTINATSAIHFIKEHSTLFMLPNMFGGVLAEVKVTEGGTLVSLDECVAGISTVLVINQLRAPLTIWQDKNDNHKIELDGEKMIYFAWESSEGQNLFLSCFGSGPVSCVISKSGRGTLGDTEVGWASFMIGAQYCLLVSCDEIFLEGPSQPSIFERPILEVEMSLQKISLSLVNDEMQNELFYMVMTSSGIVWENQKLSGKKWRPFSVSETLLIEKWYQIYKSQLGNLKCSYVQNEYQIDQNIEVNYALMESTKPFHRKIKRVFQPALWLKFINLTKERNLHLKVNAIQIDNQMFDVKFPVVFSRTPQPKSVISDTVPKPFLELSVIESLETTGFHCYKYITLLIQEFNLQLELPFLFAIMNTIMPSAEGFDLIYTPEKFKKDSIKIEESLADLVSIQHQSSRRDFYHYIHLSPIKMHLGFSLTSHCLTSADVIGSEIIHLFLHSVGVPLTETQDAVFRLGFFEKYNYWMNYDYLTAEVINHYTKQVLKQLYVFVLGLDALGNPYGLFLGVTKGFEDLFYEPIQGAVEGPGDFAEGLKHGVQSFMGKTVGGAAGAFSKITGTIGRGVASLTLDEAYKKQRREAMHRKPADNLESMARVGRGVLSGVTGGVTGVIMKPFEGAKEEGVEGFFKGVVKGGIGLVVRPVSGIVDFASESFDAVVRATDTTKQVTQFRPARYIGTNGVVQPYSYRFAEGSKIIRELEKGKFATIDAYVSHSVMHDNRNIFMVSDKRLFILCRSEIFGQWKIEWEQCYTELVEPPLLSPSGIHLSLKSTKKGLFGVFGKDESVKVIKLNSNTENKYVYGKLIEAYARACSI